MRLLVEREVRREGRGRKETGSSNALTLFHRQVGNEDKCLEEISGS